MNATHKIITSVDKDEIAEIRVFNFIKAFATNTLGTECHGLSIKKDEPIKDKSTANKKNWKNKGHIKTNQITIYDFVFNLEATAVNTDKLSSAYFLKYSRFLKDIQGKVYYSNGNVNRIILSCYGDKNKMLDFIKFNRECHSIIHKYYRLSLAALKTTDPNKFLHGRIECAFQIKNGKCLIEHIISDEKSGHKIVAGKTSQGMSSVLPNLLLAVVGRKDNFYENFMIKFENGIIKNIFSKKLHQLQSSFPDFPKLDELVRSDSFDDYLIVLEMDQI